MTFERTTRLRSYGSPRGLSPRSSFFTSLAVQRRDSGAVEIDDDVGTGLRGASRHCNGKSKGADGERDVAEPTRDARPLLHRHFMVISF